MEQKNRNLDDLNELMFDAMSAVMKPEGEEGAITVKQASAVYELGRTIIESKKTQLKAIKLAARLSADEYDKQLLSDAGVMAPTGQKRIGN